MLCIDQNQGFFVIRNYVSIIIYQIYYAHKLDLGLQIVIVITGMNREYQTSFRTKNLSHYDLKSSIFELFRGQDLNKRHNYDQLLYILDQSINTKCDRDVSHQLFTQASYRKGTASLQDIIQKYVQNLQTSKLCIIREQYKISQLQDQLNKIKDRSKSFIFFKMIQASIYTRFSKDPTFQYRILPTELPPVTLVNALNPFLNHQFTLEMEESEFQIVFFESGIEILRWTFPDEYGLVEGQYNRTVKTENVTFQAKIKYMPNNQTFARDKLKQNIRSNEQALNKEKQAFHKLCNYEPFLEREQLKLQSNQHNDHKFTEFVFDFLPFLRQHVKALFYILIATLLLQCWASSFWPIQFIDISACIFVISLLLDQNRSNSIHFLIVQLTFLMLIIKSIWGAVEEPYFQKSQTNRALIVFCIIAKIILMICLAIMIARKQQIDHMKRQLFAQQPPQQQKLRQNNKFSHSIWQ